MAMVAARGKASFSPLPPKLAGAVNTTAIAPFRQLLAALPLLVLFLPRPAACQDPPGASVASEATRFDYSNSHSFPHIFSPCKVPFVPEPRLNDTRRLQDLIVDGKLILTLDDAIALAPENNLEIAVARYDLPIAQTDLLRAKGGGATRGVAGAYQSTTLFSGSLGGGVGSAGGVGPGGVLGGGIDRVSSSPCFDPSLRVSHGWSDAITPLNYTELWRSALSCVSSSEDLVLTDNSSPLLQPAIQSNAGD